MQWRDSAACFECGGPLFRTTAISTLFVPPARAYHHLSLCDAFFFFCIRKRPPFFFRRGGRCCIYIVYTSIYICFFFLFFLFSPPFHVRSSSLVCWLACVPPPAPRIHCGRHYYKVYTTRAPLRGRLTPPATLAQGKEVCNKNHVKGTERRRPMIWCKQRFDNAKSCLCRASCPVVLGCAVCFCCRCYVLIGSTGVFCVGEKTGARERSNTCKKRKRRKVAHHNNTTYVLYPVLLYVRKKAHSAARHSTAAKGTAAHRTAPHGSARRYAALLGYISRTDLSWACIVIQQRST